MECAQTMRRAVGIARHICSEIGEGTSEDAIVTTDRFFTDLHLEGRCRGPEPISYDWSKDFDPPRHWILRGFCKTVSADDPILAHLLVSHIVLAWQPAGLVDTINDERGYMPHADLRSFLGLTAADAIPDDVDAVARQLQGAVADALETWPESQYYRDRRFLSVESRWYSGLLVVYRLKLCRIGLKYVSLA